MRNRLIGLLLILSLILVGCQQSGAGNDKQDMTNENALKELVIGHNQEFMNLTMHNGGDNGFTWYAMNCYETLVNMTDEGIQPGLAKSWEETETSLILHLQEGVKFIDGSDFNAEAVKGNLEALVQIQGPAVSFIELLNQMKSVEVIDEFTVEIKFDMYNKIYLRDLASLYPLGMMSLNSFSDGAYTEEVLNQRPLGTGPYQITDLEIGKYYVFEKNENYWGDAPDYDKVTIKIIPDQESMMLALRTKEIDIVFGSYQMSNNMYNEFKNVEGFVATESENSNKTVYLALNANQAPLDDKEVRKAIVHAIDKEIMFENIMDRKGEIAYSHFNPKLEYCDVDIVPFELDVDKANKILDDAGWMFDESGMRTKDGQALEVNLIYINGRTTNDDMAFAIQSQLKEIGCKLNIEGLDMMTWWGQAMSGDYNMSFSSTIGVPYDPYVDLKSMVQMNIQASSMAGMPEKALIDQKISEIYTTNDPEELQAIFDEIIITLHESYTDYPLFYEKEPIIYNSDKLKDVVFQDIVTFFMFDNAVLNQ